LHEREDTCQDNDRYQDDTQVQVGHVFLVLLDTVANEAKDTTTPKKEGEETSKFLQEKNVPWGSFFLLKSVISPFGMLLGSSLWSEAVDCICAKSLSKSLPVSSLFFFGLVPSYASLVSVFRKIKKIYPTCIWVLYFQLSLS